MRIAILSDIHGNLTALEAVIADLHKASPDLILHGGDLADSGSSPLAVVDRLRALGWSGVMGNTDEMLVHPESLVAFAAQSAAPSAIWNAIREIAAATRSLLGDERMTWLGALPRTIIHDEFALVHASPQSCWRAPSPQATDVELEATYRSLERSVVVFAHTHQPMIRPLSGPISLLVNTGSVGLPYDGDPRASYLLLDEGQPTIRRVEYDLEKELYALSRCCLPGAAWTAKMLRSGSPQMP